MSVGFYIISLPMGITLGIFIGVLNLIPYLQVLGYTFYGNTLPATIGSTGQSFWLVLLMAAHSGSGG